MARYFRGEPSDKSDCGGDETEEKKSGLNFTPHAPCQFAAAVKRAKVPRGPPPTTAIQRRGRNKRIPNRGQLGIVKPPIKTSMRVTKNNYFKHSFINHPFFLEKNGTWNGTFCERINFS